MAKIRVYELARDLNLENKILLSKLNDLDISVKSHMSALDDDTVDIIKQQLFGKKAETVEETRIKPTVIRRRKKVTVEVAPEPISKMRPELPKRFQDLILRCLDKKPDGRYKDAAELLVELNNLNESVSREAPEQL